ncbi:hypothetical protein [Niabella hirudinis]|uniref:hypothetical protein n=1 Tax=Niabella hirudinis TaxID=1285929 RepID=UPI003EBA356A
MRRIRLLLIGTVPQLAAVAQLKPLAGTVFGASYWDDPQEKVVALLFVQQWPLSHGELADKFKALV